ncbi:hypothetical protein SAMN04488498_12320 [Mesorhizobium albiziae]|uniref:Uncharacterized protein n=1 Tax=Neomesorhizobium albiziae TaxID=335020 RepID=A0A1I4E7B1_9HYPH|nr:hypothetical protein [Mesorhizobium albiziae]GLS33856.1 hypothetical protein GCM10007937_55690 [Mesorhizobium albiziae]SFL01143.1 hypothetical protein SAMN04488498_12320 [Mesorhizobium albiziae]
MANILKIGFALLAAAAGAGCTTEDYTRADGLTSSAGNAMYANTVMQMVDPWQPGVQHTKLRVPADRNSQANASPADAPSQPAAPSTTE